MILSIVFLTTCLKLLLIPSYRSTDFEVHRNWLAITHSLPIKKWYLEETSEWTLDYPPLFAWFEYILSQMAQFFDANMLEVKNLNYASFNTVLFQRISVILTDLVLYYGVHKCTKTLSKNWKTEVVFPVLIISNVGLLIVDHIHFQYNGLLFGILFLSIGKMMENKFLQSACLFALLLNMKHIYIYLAPAYFVYLLRNCCFTDKDNKKAKSFIKTISFRNITSLGAIVLLTFFVTFAPFYDHLGQVFSRLFPFKRGLCHAYWAPNIWAVYNLVDKIGTFAASAVGFNVIKSKASMTGGLVQEVSHTLLPKITPLITMTLTAVTMIPSLLKLWMLGLKPMNFIRSIMLCGLTSFLFGWHVHEKAILMAILPLGILTVVESGDAKTFLVLSTIGHYSLLPLLFPKSLLLIKTFLFLIYTAYAFYSLSSLYPFQFCKCTLPLLNIFESSYLLGLIPLFFYENFIHSIIGLEEKLPFLPLMLTSVYCSLGVIYSWLKYYIYFMYRKL